MTPQQILQDYKKDIQLEENAKLLAPAYKLLYEDAISAYPDTSDGFRQNVKKISNYFDLVLSIASEEGIRADSTEDKLEGVGGVIKKISQEDLDHAAAAVNEVVKFIANERTSINNLSFLIWMFFNKSSQESLVEKYLDNLDEIKTALTNPLFFVTLVNYPSFGKLILQDLLFPIEIKSPTRRKGSFANNVFKLVFEELKMQNKDRVSIEELKNSTGWYITETGSTRIAFPRASEDSKKIDMIAKIGTQAFVCSHKEQNQGGGGQDNQAKDAAPILHYSEEQIEEIKTLLNVEKVNLCLILEGNGMLIKSRYWENVVNEVADEDNDYKYLLNSYQFLQLARV